MTQAFKFRAALLVLLCSSGLMLAYAADTTDTSTTTDTTSQDYLCGQAMLDQGATLVVNYEDFLNEFFQVDTPSSDQFEDALSQYRFTVMAIQATYQGNLNLSTATEPKTLEVANAELAYCGYVRDAYLDYIKMLFQRQIMGSTASKVTFKVVDGLKAMNKDLDTLSETFSATFPTLFSKMNNDLPCYVRSCVTK
jgi:hypothetical protein